MKSPVCGLVPAPWAAFFAWKVRIEYEREDVCVMTEEYTIPLAKIIKELSLTALHLPYSAEEILIRSRDVIRPGLELYGFCDYFDPHRITVLGRSEMAMLDSLGEEKKTAAIDHFFALKPATVIVARGIEPCDFMRAAADKYDIPLPVSYTHLQVKRC